MAKATFMLIVALLLVLSIHAVLGDDNMVSQAKEHMGNAAEVAKGAAEGISESASDAFKEAKETTSTWGDWFKDKFHDMGFGDDDHPRAPDSA